MQFIHNVIGCAEQSHVVHMWLVCMIPYEQKMSISEEIFVSTKAENLVTPEFLDLLGTFANRCQQ